MPEHYHSRGSQGFPRALNARPSRLVLALALLSFCAVVSLAVETRTKGGSPGAAEGTLQAAPARPEVVMDVTRRDYGDVFAGEELNYPFNVLNAGTAPLELMQRATSSRAGAYSSPSLAIGGLHGAELRYRLVAVASRLAAPS